VSTAGEPQFTALQRLDPSIRLNTSTAGQQRIKFGKGEAISIGTATVPTPLGPITFHVVPANTPFLLCLQDMDRIGAKLDNIDNMLVQGNLRIPVVRKWGHPWMLLHNKEQSLAYCHLTESELRRLHRRFGHPSVQRLYKVLQRSGNEIELTVLEHLTKYCHHCQMNAKAPGRFKFTLQNDYNFNYEIVIDVTYLDGKPVLHVVDTATAFQAARFLKDLSAKCTWDTLKLCWIDTYLGPPDYVITDAGRNFTATEFKQHAKLFAVDIKEMPVEAHNSIGKIERYHAPLRRAFKIIQEELPDMSKENVLQMAIKAINDTAGPDGLVPTLLVFGSYPRMTTESPPSPSIFERAEAIRKASDEVRRLYAKRQVQDALAMRNGPSTDSVLQQPLQSDVRVFREGKGWTGPHKLLAIEGETCTVGIRHRPVQFRSTVVKPYYTESKEDTPPKPSGSDNTDDVEQPLEATEQPAVRRSSRKRTPRVLDTWLTAKEAADYQLSLKLRAEGKITTPGKPFEQSDRKEIDGLIGNGVFRFENYDPGKHGQVRIFKSRLVREVKGKATGTPYEKSRLVIQGHSDEDKDLILTQSPTIQRASQRLIVAIAASLLATDKDYDLWLRDITQAYTQSKTPLARTVLAQPPKEIKHLYPANTIMVVVKPLYGLAEAGTHWWATYFKHHKEKLQMETSTYDPCLLITQGKNRFGVVGMQTDDTIILANKDFADFEEKELIFTAKPKEQLSPENPLIFNGCVLTKNKDTLTMRQKEQGKKIELVNSDNPDFKEQYIQQRARGAYIASICQPEASFDMSVAAQHQEPTKEDVTALNKRLKWQLENLDRGLNFIPIGLATAKLFVFVDGSFANNKDYSSQIGHELIIANETAQEDKNEFDIKGNLIHWSSTKSKRVTRSVLASEIYGMVGGVDMAHAVATTLQKITEQLDLPAMPVVVCTDSYSLYECLVKLGSTKEKRLMIDLMALRQMYERRELFEIRWINGHDNPADAMTKGNSNTALETFINTNKLRIRVEGWVKRGKRG
jgi:hypothetical protein